MRIRYTLKTRHHRGKTKIALDKIPSEPLIISMYMSFVIYFLNLGYPLIKMKIIISAL